MSLKQGRTAPVEEKLLEALLNPENRFKSVTELCEIAGCSRPYYYNCFKKPAFVARYKQAANDMVKSYVGPILNAFVREAQRGSFQHGKLLLEMADMYAELTKQETKNVNTNLNANADMSEADDLVLQRLRQVREGLKE